MYLPTFWKLCSEAGIYKARHAAGWAVPAAFFGGWVLAPSIYNWVFSTIIPPPRGVTKRDV